jgi:hypothetical protein
MLKPVVLLSLAAALSLPAASAQAQRMYKCVDAKGKVYYTQIPPKECQGQTTQELSKQGRIVKENVVLTPEQLAARDAQAKKKAEEDRAAADDRRKATALLNTYASEKDIEDARSRALKVVDDAIKAAERRVAEAQKRREGFEKEKEFYAKKAPPPKLQQDIQQTELEIKNQRELADAKKKEVGTINAKYDEDKRRYHELTARAPGKR